MSRPTGQQLVDLARKHIGEPYVFGSIAPKYDAGYHGPWDCAEFPAWIIYQAAHILYGCSTSDPERVAEADAYTGYFARDCLQRGNGITVKEAATFPGALVLRLPKPRKTGHIVISDGLGGTVEAHSTKLGVIQHKLAGRAWDIGILVPGIEYTQLGRETA